MEPTVYAIFRAMKDGNREEADRILQGHTGYAVGLAVADEAARLRKIVESHRRDKQPNDGGETPREYAEGVECVVNPILAEIDHPAQAEASS